MSSTVRPPPPEILTIPIGVDPDRFKPDFARRSGRVALGVGLVAPMKRWHLAARALKGTGIELRIAGPIAQPSYAQEVRAAGDAVTILGEVDDAMLQAEYSGADLLVHPSRVELLAGVVLQGLSAGLPVLGASPVAGLAEEGVSGWTAPPTASDDEIVRLFRERALQVTGDPALRLRMAEAARSRAIAEFSWPSVVARHVALYERLRASGQLGRSPRLG
jgi:starch synthase